MRLEDVCIKGTSTIRQKDVNESGRYPVYGAAGPVGFMNSFQYDEPYVGVVKDGAGIGRATYLPSNSSIIGTMQALIPKNSVLPKYLYYAVSSMHLEKYYSGATIPHIYFKNYKHERFVLVSKKEQEQIIWRFSLLEKMISNKQQQLLKLDELIKARFVEMFGDIKANDKLWPTESFNSLFEVTSSKRILKSNWQSSGNIPFLRVRDMVCLSKGKELNNEFYISEKLYDSLSDIDGVPAPGDILISATSTLGKCHIVLENEKFYFKDADILRFRPRKEINATYFVEAMENFYIRDQINRTLGVTTVKHLTIKATKSLFMRVPPISLQNEFANFVQQVDKSKVAVQKSLNETQKLYDSLMQEYFG